MFRLTVSAIIRQYYKNTKAKTDRTENEVIPVVLELWDDSIKFALVELCKES
jgi:hypothetical protein